MLGERAFPNSENAPTCGAQNSTGPAVSALIAGYLFLPQCGISRGREISSALVPVPKASVNKHDDLCLGKREVRLARQGEIPPPTLHASFPKKTEQLEFRGGVARAADARHEHRPRETAERRDRRTTAAGPATHVKPKFPESASPRNMRSAAAPRCQSCRRRHP